MNGNYRDQWWAAIHEELSALEAKGVYEEIANIPPGRRAVDSKWVLHIKRDAEGRIARFKARLVAKGFTQIPGQDFNYTFAPVARWDSIRSILTLAATKGWTVRHIDIKTAFLNGPLTEEIYMKKPEILGRGYWRLKKGLYGLKQAGRSWYLEFNQWYESLGFRRCESDWSVHIRTNGDQRSVSATSVDDILLASSSQAESDLVTQELGRIFELTDNGPVDWLLGCKVTRDWTAGSITMTQESYVTSILEMFGMTECNPASTPLPPRTLLSKDDCPKSTEERKNAEKLPYRELVGKLMYLATTTRPDLAFTVRELARFMSDYGERHWTAAKHVLRYLNGTRATGLLLGRCASNEPLLKAFTDSDWASGESRKSVSGYLMLVGGGRPVAWSSKQQSVVALSSCEAEYLACTHAACEITWLRNLLMELGEDVSGATELYCDNNGTIASTHDPMGHSRMKHIDIREHYIRQCVNDGVIEMKRVEGRANPADVFTKGLGRVAHEQAVKLLGMDGYRTRDQGGVLDGDPAS